MVQRLFRLTLLCLWLAGCATRPQAPAPAMAIPADDPLRHSPAMALLEDADLARQRGDHDAAGRHLERALNLAPGSSWIYRQLAELRLAQGQARAAEGFVRRALRFSGDEQAQYRASLYELLGMALLRQGNDAGARQARRRAAELRPD